MTRPTACPPQSDGSPSARRRRGRGRRAKRSRTVLFFMAPAFPGFLIFFGYPLIATVYYSFTEVRPDQHRRSSSGFDNYVRMFTSEPLVGRRPRTTRCGWWSS